MGTNFFIGTPSKEARDKYFGYDYELTDTPTWLYTQHVAKTSAGWLPLWEKHESFQSVKQLKSLYDTGEFILFDEYGDTYTWDEFDERVLKFNGGIRGVQKPKKIEQDKNSPFYDKNLPEYQPISHIGGNLQSYKYMFVEDDNDYFIDPDGYEFTTHEFSQVVIR